MRSFFAILCGRLSRAAPYISRALDPLLEINLDKLEIIPALNFGENLFWGGILVHLEILWFGRSGRFIVPPQTALLSYGYDPLHQHCDINSGFNSHSYYVVADLDKALYDNYHCLVTLNKQ